MKQTKELWTFWFSPKAAERKFDSAAFGFGSVYCCRVKIKGEWREYTERIQGLKPSGKWKDFQFVGETDENFECEYERIA